MELNSDEIVKYLMEAGFDTNAANRRNETALVMAVHKNNEKIVKILIDYDATVDHKYYPQNNGPLHIAVDKGYVELIKVLLEAGCNVNAKSRKQYTPTPLIIAIQNRNIEVVKMLLDAGATRDHTYYRVGKGPLHIACMNGHLEMVKLLINAGYEVTAEDRTGLTPLHSTLTWSKSLNDNKDVRNIIQVLIQAGADPNAKDKWNSTPLHIAADRSCNDAVDILLNAGADPNAIDDNEFTPLLYIAEYKYKNIFIARRLIEAGADINKPNFTGQTCVHLAIKWASVEILTLMIGHGAKFELVDENNMDPLGYALSEWSRENLFAYLGQAKYDMQVQLDKMIENDQGTDIIENQIKSIEFVCKHGLKINQIMDATDRYFRDYSHSDIVNTLLCQGLIVDFRNSKVDRILKSTKFCLKNVQRILLRHAALCNVYKKGDGVINFNIEKLDKEKVRDYENYIGELRSLKDYKVYESMPLYNLIEGPITSRYILNERLIQLFETGYIDRSFPAFKDVLTKRFEKERKKYELILKATTGLQSLINFNQNSFSIIYCKILEYLETEDLHNIASLLNMETS